MIEFCGRAYVLGDNVNTDYIISSRRKRDTLDLDILKQFILEDIRPGFYDQLKNKTAILVAGTNFGCGSAMEVAAQILPANNIHVLLALSFARSFYRNCINNGVLAIETETRTVCEGDILKITMTNEAIVVSNTTKSNEVILPPVSPQVHELLSAGGLVNYFTRSKTTVEKRAAEVARTDSSKSNSAV